MIRDISLSPSGEKKIAWVERNMPLCRAIGEEFARTKPFAGIKIALSVHLEAKTAYLCRILAKGGAEMHVTGSNPLSTQDDVAAALAAGGMDVNAFWGCTEEEYTQLHDRTLSCGPHIIIDDGGDLMAALRSRFPQYMGGVIGLCEETTTGVLRLHQLDKAGQLPFPAILVNDADCKHLFDNRYGTGQSVWDGIMRTTNLIIAGKDVVVSGYGWCGKGVSLRAKGLGARVTVTEVDPIRALEAVMDGFTVMPMDKAAEIGDIFVTVTGCCQVITSQHFLRMKEGAILANAGHFNVEVDMSALEKTAVRSWEAKRNITGYELPNGRSLFVLAEGRLVNLASGDGHPAEIMDMSFALQALSARYLAENRGKLQPGILSVPHSLDLEVAWKKLSSMGISIDALTQQQKDYLGL